MHRIHEIRERYEAARNGQWKVINANEGDPIEYGTFWVISCEDDEYEFVELHVGDYPTANFIAHSREDIPFLLDEVERLTAENESLDRKLAGAISDLSALGDCSYCDIEGDEHTSDEDIERCEGCRRNTSWSQDESHWEWRGMKEEER